MARLWRADAGPLLIAFMALDLAIWIYTGTAGARLNAGHDLTAQEALWTALDGFLVWRVWRGGRVSWAILLVLGIVPLAQMTLGGGWTAYGSGLAAFMVAQICILLAPAVRHQVVGEGRQPSDLA
jgi:hypothetical protein